MKSLFSLESIDYTVDEPLIPRGYYFMSCDATGAIRPPYWFIHKSKEIKGDLASNVLDFYPPTDFKSPREAIRFVKANFKFSMTTRNNKKVFEIEHNDQ